MKRLSANKTYAPARPSPRAKAKKDRRRVVGKQGAHLVKAPVLREELFRWFCSVRNRIKGRLPMSVLLSKALAIRMLCIKAALEIGARPNVPRLVGSNWLQAWRAEYRVSLRRPNKRWKVPRSVLLERLAVMWRNLIRVRTLALLVFGYDLEAQR